MVLFAVKERGCLLSYEFTFFYSFPLTKLCFLFKILASLIFFTICRLLVKNMAAVIFTLASTKFKPFLHAIQLHAEVTSLGPGLGLWD